MEPINQAYKYELDPTRAQKRALAGHCGLARFAFNWGLYLKITSYDVARNRPKEERPHAPTSFTLMKLWTEEKEELVWPKEYSRRVVEGAMRNLDRAYDNFFRRIKTGGPAGFPKFKGRGSPASATFFGATIRSQDKTVTLPTIGQMRTKEPTRVKGKITSATISRRANRWWVSFLVERTRVSPGAPRGGPVGIDMGLSSYVTLSTGEKIMPVKALRGIENRLERAQRTLSRRVKGSENRKKQKEIVAKLHLKAANVRANFIHNITTRLAKEFSPIVIEDLKIKNMVKNHCLAKSISDAAWGEFRRQLEYKTKWYGSELIVVGTYFASTQTCSACGCVREGKDKIKLSNRIFVCPDCGYTEDRDVNAAKNLMKYGTAKQAGTAAKAGTPVETGVTWSQKQEPAGAGPSASTLVEGISALVGRAMA